MKLSQKNKQKERTSNNERVWDAAEALLCLTLLAPLVGLSIAIASVEWVRAAQAAVGMAVIALLIAIPVAAHAVRRLLERSSLSNPAVEKEKAIIKVKRPPFSSLKKLAEILPARYAQDLEQNISDLRIEYFEALHEKKFIRARTIAPLYYIGLGWSILRWIAERAKELVGFIPKVS